MKTRKSKTASSSQAKPDAHTAFPTPESDPVRLLLLPSNAGPDARICTLAHPATSKPCRYYICPNKGVYEFQRILASRGECRSWLLSTRRENKDCGIVLAGASDGSQLQRHSLTDIDETAPTAPDVSHGHTIKEPELFVATPIDPLFLILPALQAQITKSSKGLFLSFDDLADVACDTSIHLRKALGSEIIRRNMEIRMTAICDTVDAGDETMYRLNIDNLIAELIAKTKRVIQDGLPASMEAKFVAKALEAPVMSLKKGESSISLSTTDTITGLESQSANIAESQCSTATTESGASELSAQTELTVPDLPSQISVSTDIVHLLRLRTALNFILSSYVPPSLVSDIKATLLSSSPIDFNSLDAHLNHLAKLRAEAQATRSLSDFNRKRSMVDDDEAAEAKAEKRQKKAEEEKRQKAGQTRAIRDLKKVDVSGMKKMSDFFGKGAAAAKKN
ncbi:MAG: hypothetical protein Q9170_002012 [Blastenia crenularia]